MALADNGPPWLAAYTRPRHERKIAAFCDRARVEAYLPTYRTWRIWSDRRKQLDLPLFPGYVFIRAHEAERLRVLAAPGLLWFVHDRRGFLRVAAREIDAVRRMLRAGLSCDPLPWAHVGDEVEIVRGVLRGCRGRLIHKQASAVALVITAIGASVRVSLPDASWVVPTHAARRPPAGRQDWPLRPVTV